MKFHFIFFVYFFTTCLYAISASAQRIGRSNEDWRVIRTPHFEVVVRSTQLDLGRYYARAAEKAHSDLSTVFSQMPSHTVVIINDTTDIPNGYATRIPYPHIMVFAAQTNDHDWLSENGDWAKLLLTHELTHITQFEPANGFYKILRPIFGHIIAPNMLLPSWWKEGMSVEIETQFSETGRTRSIYQDAALRAIVLENKLKKYDLPQANETLPSWPYGTRPYLFGSLFFSQLVMDTQNLKSIDTLTQRHGERVPYFVEEPMKELTGSSYEVTYNRSLVAVEQNAIQQVKALKTAPLSEIDYVRPKSLSSLRPSYSSAHGLLAYIEQTEDDAKMTILDSEGKPLELKSLPSGTISSLAFHPTEKKIFYTRIDQIDSRYIFSDLHVYDIDLQKSEQLSRGARARAVSLSDDGTKAVFITTDSGQTQIRWMDLTDKKIQFVISAPLGYRYESPIFWSENEILAVKMDPAGRHSLVKIDLQLSTETALDLKAKNLRFLKKKNGSLYFTSSDSGVNNIYKSSDLVSYEAVTHVSTGIWSFDLNPEETKAWTSLMTGKGFQLTEVKLKKQNSPLPQIQNHFADRYLYKETPNPEMTELVDEEYSGAGYLWPSYWIPFVSTSSSSRGVFVQAQTTGHDPLKIHQYGLILAYDSELDKTLFNGNYVNSSTSLPFKLSSVSRSFGLGSNLSVVESTTHSLGVLPDMFFISKNLVLETGVQLQSVNFTQETRHWGPYLQLLYMNYSKDLFSISPESGWGAQFRYENLSVQQNDESGLAARNYDRAYLTYVGFFSKWLPEHHAIKTRLSGQWTFQSVLGRYGASNSTQFIEDDGLSSQYIVRGYLPAQFFGRNIANANLEYRFPLARIERGSGTDAYYFKRLSGALVTDAVAVDGFGSTEDLTGLIPLKSNQIIASAGVELKLETTLGYVLPFNFILGYYWPFDEQFSSSSQLGLSLQIGSFF